MRSVPRVTVSSPARSRSRVDLPQPDGPTTTISSQSSMWRLQSETARLPLAYALSTCSKSTVAMGQASDLRLQISAFRLQEKTPLILCRSLKTEAEAVLIRKNSHPL